ncbi:PREDICTED: dirigent protein 22-like [Nicotiana attenuata]|uniref:Dirigent protein n=1 Tax=Nicotiana attenuata TaxID=49451 RepID=A0A1J6III6_NICAT|nr:PREDICTED: dirigent protein 22-like [Nicotiana attenuata]OIT00336.1 dirigent protein 1 [Nicotiana attenuata]
MASNSFKLSLILLLTIFINSEAELDQLKETRMTLYFQDWSGGPNATVLQIRDHQNGPLSFAKFGSVFVTDDPITEAFDKNSAEIARAQGIYVTSALDGTISHVLISIIFRNKEYKGSTLEIQGASPQFERVREVAVVGGTRKFRLARGYATFETIHFDLAVHHVVIQFNVTVLHY